MILAAEGAAMTGGDIVRFALDAIAQTRSAVAD